MNKPFNQPPPKLGNQYYEMPLADRLNEPVLMQWDAWGERVDRIEVSPLWQVALRVAAEHGVVAAAYELRYGPFSPPLLISLRIESGLLDYGPERKIPIINFKK